MTKIDKEIDEIVERNFFYLDTHLYHAYLCLVFIYTNYDKKWDEFWRLVNSEKRPTLRGYFKNSIPRAFELALLRLLLVEEFKKWLKEQ